MPVLKINNLCKNYGSLKALDNLNLEIEKGQVFGLLGPNGSGKTTTLGTILGILRQTSGSFEWFNGEYTNPRKKIGSILETPNFFPYLNAIENLEIVRRIKQTDNRNFDELLEQVNLLDRKKSTFKTYSLGMKQRLAIAATLLSDPDVLIFDEPTNGLDPQGIAEVRTILMRIANSGKTVILASHILDEVEKVCNHVAIIKKGKLLATGPVGSILSNDITMQLASNDMEELERWLSSLSIVKKVSRKKDFIECQVDESIPVTEINKLAFQNNISLTHLVAKKQSLEEEFLAITSKS